MDKWVSLPPVSTVAAEIDNIVAWAAENNLRLNISKSREVLFCDNRRGKLKTLPPSLPNITRESSLKILGVTFSNNLSASDHIRHIVSESAQTLYALRVPRHHGLSGVRLQEVFRAVVVSRLTNASTAWNEFVTAADIRRAFLRRSKRCGFCPPSLPDSWRSATTDFSIKSATTRSMSYIAFCRHHLPPVRTMVCDPVGMTDSYRLTLVVIL